MDATISNLKKNILFLYCYAFFNSFLVVIPIIVPYWHSKNLSTHQIFLLQGVFGGALILFDVPAGYLADLFGRRRALLFGSIVSLLGFQLLWMGETFFDFLIYEFILGFGLSLQSGADVAILYSSLEKLGYSGRKSHYLGRRIFFSQVGETLAALLGGFLAIQSLRAPVLANAITPIGSVIFAFLLKDNNASLLKGTSHFENFKMIRKALFGHSRLLTLLILAFIFYSFASYSAVWILQPYWSERGIKYEWFGYLWAFNSLCVAVVGVFAHRIELKMGGTLTVLMIALTPILGFMGMGFGQGWYGMAFMLFFPICRGLNQVLFQDAVNARVPVEIRATANSIGSLGMRMMFLFFGPLLGKMIDQQGPAPTMQYMGGVYLLGFFIVALPLLGQRKNFVI